MSAVVYVNETIARGETASIPVFDHGFLYGEGIYETLRTYHGEPFLFDHHAQRLRRSAAFMALTLPWSDADLLARVRETMAAHGGLTEAYIRILVTRGVGDLSYNPAATPVPSLVIIVKPLEDPPARVYIDGIKISLVSILRNHPRSVNPVIKSNNLLNNALAMQEANRRGAEESLMCNYRGELSECSQANFFLVKDGVARTPKDEAGLLEGLTRNFLFEVGQDVGVPVRYDTLYPRDLESAEEAFITSTTRELSPVTRIDDRPVGNGKPGPVTLKLLDGYRTRALALTRIPAGRPL
jgi:branched-chain amino acid aminotransferase